MKRLGLVLLMVLSASCSIVFLIPAPPSGAVAASIGQPSSTTCSSCTSVSLTMPAVLLTAASPEIIVAGICFSGAVTSLAFSDSYTVSGSSVPSDTWEVVITESNTVECALAWARGYYSLAPTVKAAWTTSTSAVLFVGEGVDLGAEPLTVNRNDGTGSGTSFSVGSISGGSTSLSLACYATTAATQPTFTAGSVSTYFYSLSATGGSTVYAACEDAVNVNTASTLPMTASVTGSWAGVGEVFLQETAQANSCTDTAVTTTATCAVAGSWNYVAVGDLMIVGTGRADFAGTHWTISDSLGNCASGWNVAANDSNAAHAEIWWCKATVQGADTVTIDYEDTVAKTVFITIETCSECSIEGVADSTGTGSGTPYSVASMTFATGPALAVVAGTSNLGDSTAGSGWSSSVTLASIPAWSEYRTFTTPTANTCPSTSANSGVQYVEVCVSAEFYVVNRLMINPAYEVVYSSATDYFNITAYKDGSPITDLRNYGYGDAFRAVAFLTDQSTTVSLSAIAAGSSSTQRWVIKMASGSPASYTYSTGTAASVSPVTPFYEQYLNTCNATPLSHAGKWDGIYTIIVLGTQAGVSGSTVCSLVTANGGGAVNGTGWSDIGQSWAYLNATGTALIWDSSVPSTGYSYTPAITGSSCDGTTSDCYADYTEYFTQQYVTATQTTTTTTPTTTTTTSYSTTTLTTTTTISTSVTPTTTTEYVDSPPNFDWTLLLPFVLLAVVLALTAGRKKFRIRL